MGRGKQDEYGLTKKERAFVDTVTDMNGDSFNDWHKAVKVGYGYDNSKTIASTVAKLKRRTNVQGEVTRLLAQKYGLSSITVDSVAIDFAHEKKKCDTAGDRTNGIRCIEDRAKLKGMLKDGVVIGVEAGLIELNAQQQAAVKIATDLLNRQLSMPKELIDTVTVPVLGVTSADAVLEPVTPIGSGSTIKKSTSLTVGVNAQSGQNAVFEPETPNRTNSDALSGQNVTRDAISEQSVTDSFRQELRRKRGV